MAVHFARQTCFCIKNGFVLPHYHDLNVYVHRSETRIHRFTWKVIFQTAFFIGFTIKVPADCVCPNNLLRQSIYSRLARYEDVNPNAEVVPGIRTVC